MLLQLLFMLAFWSGVYVIHEQATAILRAQGETREREDAIEREARERKAAIERIRGRWVLGDERIVSFQDDWFVLIHRRAVSYGSWRFKNGTYLLAGFDFYFYNDCRARITGDELEIECFRRDVMSWVVAGRFRRPKD
jgi:hypothetical protein